MLNIHIPTTYIPERTYIINVIMRELLGTSFQLISEPRSDVLIHSENYQNEKALCIADILFQTPVDQWLKETSLPKQPLPTWNTQCSISDGILVSPQIPIIYGREGKPGAAGYLIKKEQSLYLGLDIFGSAFFMLTRYEEYVKKDRDQHDRFPSTASLAYQEDFLSRPIINEYVEILWYCMQHLWPGLERKQRKFRTILSHDVDVPLAQAFSGVSQLIRNCGGDIVKRKSLIMAIRRFGSWQAVKKGNYKQDFNYTFDRIMDISEQNNIKSAFYFKTACTNSTFDDNYSINHPYIRQLMRDIFDRGHEIGLHTSYETYQDPEHTKLEFERLLQACEEAGIQQDRWGGRQHYLRWQVPVTWRNLNEAGLNYDSTLSYDDQAGFRCGICCEFSVFDLEKRQILSLSERPLIVMEASILGEQHMNLSDHEALSYMATLKKRCQQFNGDFTLLWHNSSFDIPQRWAMYTKAISGQII